MLDLPDTIPEVEHLGQEQLKGAMIVMVLGLLLLFLLLLMTFCCCCLGLEAYVIWVKSSYIGAEIALIIVAMAVGTDYVLTDASVTGLPLMKQFYCGLAEALKNLGIVHLDTLLLRFREPESMIVLEPFCLDEKLQETPNSIHLVQENTRNRWNVIAAYRWLI